ncbi:MAG: MlaD family protein [bacterium]
MSDRPDPSDLATGEKPAPFWTRLSVVWIVPLLALIVSLGVAWRTFEDRGIYIQIVFPEVAGVELGKTVLKFREVTVGKVETINFTNDLSQVVVGVRVDNSVAPFIDSDAQFWLVRPELTTSGISRLDTVLSGTFIEGLWDAEIKFPATNFVALKQAPLSREPGSGTSVTLSSSDGGSLAEGAPVIYRGIKVGQLRNLRLNDKGPGVTVDAFIKSPFDERLTTASVFWDTSGFSVSLGAQGLKLNVRSLASLIQGGVEFTTLVSGGKPVEPAQEFRLYDDEASARQSVFSSSVAMPVGLSLLLDGSIQNLSIGTPVQYRGLSVGEVTALSIRAQPTPGGQQVFRQEVDFAVNGDRMGLPAGQSQDDVRAFLKEQVKEGLRARVSSTGILGGALQIELIYLPDAPPDTLNLSTKPYPVMPTVPSKITDFSKATGDVLGRVQKLPIEEVMQSTIRLLDSANQFIAKDETQQAPEQVVGLLGDLRAYVGKPSTQKVPEDLSALLTDLRTLVAKDAVQQAPEKLTKLIDDIDAFFSAEGTQKAPAALTALIGDLRDFMAKSGTQKAPDAVVSLVDDLRAFLAKDGTQKAPEELTALLTELRNFVASPDLQALPGTLRGSLTDLQSLMADLNKANVITHVITAFDNVSEAATSVTDATSGLPALVDAVSTMATKVNSLPLDAFISSASETVDAIGAFLRTDGMQNLPTSLGTALDALAATLKDVRDGGAVANLNAALQSAKSAADAVAKATDQVPDILTKIDDLIANINRTVAGYGSGSAFGRQVQDVLREVQRAATSIGSLAKTIERNPQAFILGR